MLPSETGSGTGAVEPAFTILIVMSALSSGLMAGVFFAFSNFVMRALARQALAEGIRAMQAINVTALNRQFLAVFLGSGVMSAVAAPVALLRWNGGAPYIVPGAAYLPGSILVTMRGNVPLNNALAALRADDAKAVDGWSDYVRAWTRWNDVRTIACTVACAPFIAALWST